MIWSAFLATVCLLLLAACVFDVSFRTIPNWISAALFLLALPFQIRSGHPLFGVGSTATVFLFVFLCWKARWIGGGDVKLLTACSFLLPPTSAPVFLLSVALLGGGLAVAYITARQVTPRPYEPRPRSLPQRIFRVERWRIAGGRSIPYACAVSGAALFILLSG